MHRIQILDAHVAEKIAAGEVIERPASVVKELVENSLDAGCTEVCVILEAGGKSLIEVTDNGHGMNPDDLKLCLFRHATSKLRSMEDLERVLTLGFRGEALPSVAAVSELTLISRTDASDSSYQIVAGSAGASQTTAPERITFGHYLGSPHGTCIRARGLFAQIPARLKFLKSQASEVGQVREWMERLALTHPQVGFKLFSDDRTVLNLRPQEEVARVKSILADGEDYPVISFSNENELSADARGQIRVRAHWLQGMSSPQTRKLVQIINGRAVRDRLVQQALLTPFRQALLPGQFPAVALYVDVDPSTLDVNVHPTKTELRFLDTRKVFHAIERLIDSMIVQHGAPGFAASQNRHTQDFNTTWDAATRPPNQAWMASDSNVPHPQNSQGFQPSFLHPPSHPSPSTRVDPGNSSALLSTSPFHSNHFAGILFNTYLLYDLGEELVMIDQHAAHERIRYERLKSRVLRGDSGQPQALLMPEVVKFPAEARVVLEPRLKELEKWGFEVELFGDDTVLVRSIPSDWGSDSLRTRLKTLVEKLILPDEESRKHSMLDEALFETLASQACHSAIRAGDRLEPVEAVTLTEDLFRCEHPWNCPHGRPTVVRIPKGRFEEWFQRRV